MCRPCFNGKSDATHPLHHVFATGAEVRRDNSIKYHFGVFCRICYRNNFSGDLYQCEQCRSPGSFDVCSKCIFLANSSHPNHTFVFVPNAKKIHFNRLILAYRAMRLLKQSGAKAGDRDELTGWTMLVAASVVATESLALQKLTLPSIPASRAMALLEPERTVSSNRLGTTFANFMLQFYFEQQSTKPIAAIPDDSTNPTPPATPIPQLKSSKKTHRSSGGATANASNDILHDVEREQDENDLAEAVEDARYHRFRKQLHGEIHRKVKRRDDERDWARCPRKWYRIASRQCKANGAARWTTTPQQRST